MVSYSSCSVSIPADFTPPFRSWKPLIDLPIMYPYVTDVNTFKGGHHMTKYREILRLASLNLSQTNIALSWGVSKKTVNKVLKAAKEKNLAWPLDATQTDPVIDQLLFPKIGATEARSNKRIPDFAYIRKELLRNGVNKKLLWTEYLEECRLAGDEPLMYSQFCYHI